MPKKPIQTIFVEETNSTNELAKALLKKKEISLPFVVQTAFQTQGKGQYKKSWESNPEENLLFSLVVKAPQIEIEKQFDISKAVAVAIREIVNRITGAKVCIKWPNDIYVGDEKIAGVLIESTIIGQKIDTCIIGIGLNINQIEFSEELPNPTSLKRLTGNEQKLEVIKDDIIDAISAGLLMLYTVEEQYDKYLYRKGELGKFIDNSSKEFLGVIVGIDKLGKLLVRTENSLIRSFSNNEVQFVLPETK